MEKYLVEITILLIAAAFLALMLGFGMGRDSIQREIKAYGCEAVVKTWSKP